jgi:hypothetical protein
MYTYLFAILAISGGVGNNLSQLTNKFLHPFFRFGIMTVAQSEQRGEFAQLIVQFVQAFELLVHLEGFLVQPFVDGNFLLMLFEMFFEHFDDFLGHLFVTLFVFELLSYLQKIPSLELEGVVVAQVHRNHLLQ